METKDKKKAIIIAVVILAVLIIILILTYRVLYYNTDEGQIDLLVDECSKTMEFDEKCLSTIVTKGEFAIIEQAYKEYASKIIPYMKECFTIFENFDDNIYNKNNVKNHIKQVESCIKSMNKIWNGKNYWTNKVEMTSLKNEKAVEAYIFLVNADKIIKNSFLGITDKLGTLKNLLS